MPEEDERPRSQRPEDAMKIGTPRIVDGHLGLLVSALSAAQKNLQKQIL